MYKARAGSPIHIYVSSGEQGASWHERVASAPQRVDRRVGARIAAPDAASVARAARSSAFGAAAFVRSAVLSLSGQKRANGAANPQYTQPYVFANDFSALDAGDGAHSEGLLTSQSVSGECRVLCYSPRHDLSLGDLPPQEAVGVVRAWRAQFGELDARRDLAYVLVFENRGEMMGASNPHPHGQIWATSVVPDEIERELHNQKTYHATHGRPLLVDTLVAELQTRSASCRRTILGLTGAVLAQWPFGAGAARRSSPFDELQRRGREPRDAIAST